MTAPIGGWFRVGGFAILCQGLGNQITNGARVPIDIVFQSMSNNLGTNNRAGLNLVDIAKGDFMYRLYLTLVCAVELIDSQS